MIFPQGVHQLTLFDNSLKENLLLLQAPKEKLSFVQVKRKVDKPIISQIFGLVIFFISSSILGLMVLPIIISETSFRLGQLKKESVRIVKNEPVQPQKIQFADLLGKVVFEPVPVPVDVNFGIVIPKIGVNAKVIANVNAEKVSEFTKALKLGVAHAAGTSLPDQEGTTFIFGHSTDYPWNTARFNAIFYQIKDLEIGDEVNIFYNGQRYFYKVTERRIVGAKDTGFLTDPAEGKRLVLQTCWPPGTTKERLLVFARPITVLSLEN